MKYEIKNQADGSESDIHINDFIGDWIDDYWGFGVTSRAFIKQIQDLPDSVKTIRLHLNTPGGDVVAASHIANTMRDQQSHKGRTFEVLIEGAAWSAGTIITSAGQPTFIADNALMMVHEPWAKMVGNSREMRKQADLNDKFRDTIVNAYQWKSKMSKDELVGLMEAETWMDADEAIANGFADGKIEGFRAAAAIDASVLAKMKPIPEKYRARVQALVKPLAIEEPEASPAPAIEIVAELSETVPVGANFVLETTTVTIGDRSETTSKYTPIDNKEVRADAESRARDILALCTKAGVAQAAAGYLDRGLTVAEVTAKLVDADKIRARCLAAKLPQRADAYIIAGMTVGEVANDLFDVLLARQGPEIDNSLAPEGERQTQQPKKTATTAEIYALRKKQKQ